MTTRAFLKTAEKKRDSAQTKEATPATPITPADPKPSATPAPAPDPAAQDTAAEPAVVERQETDKSAGTTGPADPESAPGAAAEATQPPPGSEEEVRPTICDTHEDMLLMVPAELV